MCSGCPSQPATRRVGVRDPRLRGEGIVDGSGSPVASSQLGCLGRQEQLLLAGAVLRSDSPACRVSAPAGQSNGQGEKPQGGWTDSSEFAPGSVGSTPWSAVGAKAAHPRVVHLRNWKAHEGRAQAQRLNGKPRGGERSGEHRPRRGVTPATGVRTLSRSKTLKSRAHAHQRLLPDDLETNPVSSSWTSCITPRRRDLPLASANTRLAVRSLPADAGRLHRGRVTPSRTSAGFRDRSEGRRRRWGQRCQPARWKVPALASTT